MISALKLYTLYPFDYMVSSLAEAHLFFKITTVHWKYSVFEEVSIQRL